MYTLPKGDNQTDCNCKHNSINMEKGDRVKTRTVYRKKRRGFMGNKANHAERQCAETNDPSDPSIAANNTSTPVRTKCNQTISASKLVHIPDVNTPTKSEEISGSRIVDCSMLENLFTLLHCPNCNMATVRLSEDHSKRQGLASLLVVTCSKCDFRTQCYTSLSQQGERDFDVNKRIVYSMRSCGQGYAGIENLQH